MPHSNARRYHDHVDLRISERKTCSAFGFTVRSYHEPGDPPSVNRISLEREGYRLVLLPSKGLSVGSAFSNGLPIFWDPPLINLPDPNSIDLDSPLLVSGTEMRGMGWVKYFTGGVEMLGLRNWGMPLLDKTTGELLPLHGEASVTSVQEIQVVFEPNMVTVSGRFPVPGGFGIRKRITLLRDVPRILIHDTITNTSYETNCPDWGYHVQLYPEPNCRYLIPCKHVVARNRGELPSDDYQYWTPCGEKERQERGFVHLHPVTHYDQQLGGPATRTLLRYPAGHGTLVTIPQCAYLLSWHSSGGADSDEFVVPSPAPRRKHTHKVLTRNWDGVGPEFGASSLDHDELISAPVEREALPPGGCLELRLAIESLDCTQAAALERELQELHHSCCDR